MQAAWITDVHLNFVDESRATRLCRDIIDAGADIVLLGGDLAEARDVGHWLQFLAVRLQLPIHFVLGNHDYYGDSIRRVRHRVAALSETTPHLHWLPGAGVVELSPTTALIGHDGWGDGRLGDYAGSNVLLTDYVAIHELAAAGRDAEHRGSILAALGDEAAGHVRRHLPVACARYRQVILLTHVPPLREACTHEGRVSDDIWLPHFSCKAVGDTLLEIMPAHPDCQLTVLCGHTHGAGESWPLPNLHVLTGAAEYGEPALQRLLPIA